MTSNKLQMNEDKTDVLLVTAKRIVNLQHLPEFMNINGTCIKFSPSVRNLGVTLDSTLIERLQGVQNALARLILRTSRSEHISTLLQNIHWLPVNRRTLHKVAALCHSSLSGSGPQYLSDLTHVCTPARSLRSSSDTRTLSTPNVKLKSYGQRSFAYHGPTTWNSLPLALRYQQESDCFK